MLENNRPFTRRLLFIGILLVAIIICIVLYTSTGNNYPPITSAASSSPRITNPQLLQNWLPSNVFKYLVTSIDDYLQINGQEPTSMTVQNAVTTNTDGEYVFTLILEPQEATHQITVTVTNSSGLISAAVAIDGQLQGNLSSSQSGNNIQISGLSDLVSDGITSLQGQELQSAIQKFAPTIDNATINVNSIVLPSIDPNNASLTSTYEFTININNKNYSAKLNVVGLNELELFLNNIQTGKQVFDSGIISQN